MSAMYVVNFTKLPKVLTSYPPVGFDPDWANHFRTLARSIYGNRAWNRADTDLYDSLKVRHQSSDSADRSVYEA